MIRGRKQLIRDEKYESAAAVTQPEAFKATEMIQVIREFTGARSDMRKSGGGSRVSDCCVCSCSSLAKSHDGIDVLPGLTSRTS
jgi:hypothetical protein